MPKKLKFSRKKYLAWKQISKLLMQIILVKEDIDIVYYMFYGYIVNMSKLYLLDPLSNSENNPLLFYPISKPKQNRV